MAHAATCDGQYYRCRRGGVIQAGPGLNESSSLRAGSGVETRKWVRNVGLGKPTFKNAFTNILRAFSSPLALLSPTPSCCCFWASFSSSDKGRFLFSTASSLPLPWKLPCKVPAQPPRKTVLAMRGIKHVRASPKLEHVHALQWTRHLRSQPRKKQVQAMRLLKHLRARLPMKPRKKQCDGASICEHNRQRYSCKLCSGLGICEHSRIRRSCKDCRHKEN